MKNVIRNIFTGFTIHPIIALITTLSITGFVGLAAAQDSVKIMKKDVPKSVLNAFGKAYPNATVKTYSRETREGKTCYELESKDGKTKRDIIYAANGDVMEIEEAMKPRELPAAVMATLTKNYPNAKITAAEKLIKGAIVQYEATIMEATINQAATNEATIKTSGKPIDLLFSDAGELIRPTAK